MTVEFKEFGNVHVYDGGYVRGLPREAQEQLHSVTLRWDGGPERRWCEFTGSVQDLRAELQMNGCRYTDHEGVPGPYRAPVLAMSSAEAEAATLEMVGLFGRIETSALRMTNVACDFVRRKGWVALGFPTLDAYSAERLPFTLPRDVRKDIVLGLVAQGISNRAAAAIARTTEMTVRRDVRSAETADPQSLSTATNVAVGPPVRVGMDGRDRPARRTYEPVQPAAVWTPTPDPQPERESEPDNVYPMPTRPPNQTCVDETIDLLRAGIMPDRFADLVHAVDLVERGRQMGTRTP